MLGRIVADRFIRKVTSGRTGCVLMECSTDPSSYVEVFCKLSFGCDEGVTSLAREVVAACLAADLKLPVPTPYFVEIPLELSSEVPDREVASRLKASSPVSFGSAKVANQFGTWSLGSRISGAMVPSALSALVFDAVIENVDRRPSNPNCLISGDRFRLIDHDLAFPNSALLIGWRPPWKAGGLGWIDRPDGHIFCQGLKKRDLDFGPLPGLWSGVSDARLLEYRAAIPPEWSEALPKVDEALERIRNARDNIEGVIAEVERVLQ